MNEHIKKFYPGQTAELNLVKEPVKYEKVKVSGIDKFLPVTEPVECTVHSVDPANGNLDFIRKGRPTVVVHNHTPTAKDKVLKDVERPAEAKPEELPVIYRLKPGEKVVLSLPKEPVEWVKDKTGKSSAMLEDVPCTVHSVSIKAGTISFTRDEDKAHQIVTGFKVTDDNLAQDEPETEGEDAEAKKAAKAAKAEAKKAAKSKK
jgi:hypothetical protein